MIHRAVEFALENSRQFESFAAVHAKLREIESSLESRNRPSLLAQLKEVEELLRSLQSVQ